MDKKEHIITVEFGSFLRNEDRKEHSFVSILVRIKIFKKFLRITYVDEKEFITKFICSPYKINESEAEARKINELIRIHNINYTDDLPKLEYKLESKSCINTKEGDKQ